MTTSPAMNQAASLARGIWLDLWSQTKDRPHVTLVRTTEELSVDDLILLAFQHEQAGTSSVDGCTVREAVENSRAVWRVISVAGKSIRAHPIAVPDGTWNGTPDLTQLGAGWHSSPPEHRMHVVTKTRRMIRLAGLPELRQQVGAHGDFENWQRAYAAAETEEQEEKAAAAALWARIQEAQRPQREAAARLDEIAGETLVWTTFGSQPGTVKVDGWLASGERLRTYLSGLATIGKLTTEQYDEARQCAATLGLWPAACA